MNGYLAPEPERDSSNFDFRIVSLFTMMATQPDLLHEYLDDGANKRPDDATRWATLRRSGLPPALLSEFLTLFRLKDVRAALLVTQKLFATMVARADYCDLGCPSPDWYARLIAYTKESCQPLNRPGVELEV